MMKAKRKALTNSHGGRDINCYKRLGYGHAIQECPKKNMVFNNDQVEISSGEEGFGEDLEEVFGEDEIVNEKGDCD
jgi:hypothetical protein